jgi:ATP-dependent Clp protease adapter protein ClpS
MTKRRKTVFREEDTFLALNLEHYIAKLQAALESIPEENRDSAVMVMSPAYRRGQSVVISSVCYLAQVNIGNLDIGEFE